MGMDTTTCVQGKLEDSKTANVHDTLVQCLAHKKIPSEMFPVFVTVRKQPENAGGKKKMEEPGNLVENTSLKGSCSILPFSPWRNHSQALTHVLHSVPALAHLRSCWILTATLPGHTTPLSEAPRVK